MTHTPDPNTPHTDPTPEHDDLEDLMHVWQHHADPLDTLRDDFVNRVARAQRSATLQAAVLVIAAIAFVAGAVIKRDALAICMALTCAPLALYGARLLTRFRDGFRATPPLTPAACLSAMRHNLDQQRRHHAQNQRLLPVIALVTGAILAWAWARSGMAPALVTKTLLVAVPAYGFALYDGFWRKPRTFADEAQRLDALERDLNAP